MPRQSLVASRLTVVAVAALAGGIATDPDSQVSGLVAYAWASLGASFGPAVLFTLFWRRTTAHGLIAGMLTGAFAVVGWRALEGGVFDLYEVSLARNFYGASFHGTNALAADSARDS